MNNKYKDINQSEYLEIEKTFKKIGSNIISELNNRIKVFNTSFLYKYYSNFFYFIPKHFLLEIKGSNHNGYHITPDQPFFVNDNEKNDISLKFTPRLETKIAPVSSIETKLTNNYFQINIDFDNNFEYEEITLWLAPDFVSSNKFLAFSILKHILSTDSSQSFAEVHYQENKKSTKQLLISPLNYQLKPIEVDALSYHSSQLRCGFNIKIQNLFDFKHDKFNKISLFIKNETEKISEDLVTNLFKVNMIPIFNSYDAYSCSSHINRQVSEERLINEKNNFAVPLSVLSIYEDNKKIRSDSFIFKGENEYYFNIEHQTLNYNVLLPNLETEVKDIRIFTYSTWTDNIELSNRIDIRSNELASINCKIIAQFYGQEHSNYKISSQKIFSLIERLNTKEIFTKITIENLFQLLNFREKDIETLLDIIDHIKFNNVEQIATISVKTNFLKQYDIFLKFMMNILCEFINRNTPLYIKNFILIEK